MGMRDRFRASEWKIAMRMKYMEQFNVVAAEEYATIKRVHINSTHCKLS